MKPKTRKEYEENLKRLAIEAFAEHDFLTEVGPGHWRIKCKKKGSIYWAEIVVMSRAVAVWGDIEACIFAYGPYDTPRPMLSWISGWNFGYQCEKAAIGMTNIGDTTTDAAVAIEDVRFLIERYREDDDDGSSQENINTLNEAIGQLRSGEPVELVRHFLFDSGDFEAEDIYSIGDVVSPRVVYAVAAINRLVEMLEEIEAA